MSTSSALLAVDLILRQDAKDSVSEYEHNGYIKIYASFEPVFGYLIEENIEGKMTIVNMI